MLSGEDAQTAAPQDIKTKVYKNNLLHWKLQVVFAVCHPSKTEISKLLSTVTNRKMN